MKLSKTLSLFIAVNTVV